MEITILDKNTVKIRGKQTSVIINPTSRSKTTGDVSLYLLKDAPQDVSKIEGNRLVIQGSGEYEVGGVKINANRFDKKLGYDIKIDGLEIFVSRSSVLGKAETLQKSQEALKEYNIVLLDVDLWPQESILTSLSPSVIMLFGEQPEEGAKALGVENISKASKYQTTFEKLPAETEVVVLG